MEIGHDDGIAGFEKEVGDIGDGGGKAGHDHGEGEGLAAQAGILRLYLGLPAFPQSG